MTEAASKKKVLVTGAYGLIGNLVYPIWHKATDHSFSRWMPMMMMTMMMR